MMRRSIFLLLCLGLPPAQAAPAAPAAPAEVRVLLVGNSLSYVNNLPALFTALASRQPGPPSYRADLLAAPGGSIAERWQDGVAASEIASGRWQVLVLQERGGLLACMAKSERRAEPECAASLGAHAKFAKLAKANEMRVIVLGTWGPDSIWQGQLSRGLRKLAAGVGAEALDAGPPVRAYARTHPQTPMYSDAILHPTLDVSLLMAIELYRQLAGQAPQALALEISAPLLPSGARILADRLLSRQPQLAGDGSSTRIDAGRLQRLLDSVAATESTRP